VQVLAVEMNAGRQFGAQRHRVEKRKRDYAGQGKIVSGKLASGSGAMVGKTSLPVCNFRIGS